MSSDHIPCPVCNDSGLVRYKRNIGDLRNMPWTKACLCGHGDRYASFVERVSEDGYRMARERKAVAA